MGRLCTTRSRIRQNSGLPTTQRPRILANSATLQRPRILANSATTLTLLLAFGCGKPAEEAETLTLATTTSTQDSGLLDVLVPLFKDKTGIQVKVVAVGSGQALALGRRGDADVLLTHSPLAEEKFMAEGYGSERHPVMHNDFVLVGADTDPAKVRGKRSIAEAFRVIAGKGSLFLSRGDESGTHQKEREIWKVAAVEPKGTWYIQAGTGMAHALRMAGEKEAYTLSDRATFLALKRELNLTVVVEGDSLLKNRYSVIVVNPEKHRHLRHDAARRFAEFLRSPDGQRAIAEFGADKHGEPLFFPEAAARK